MYVTSTELVTIVLNNSDVQYRDISYHDIKPIYVMILLYIYASYNMGTWDLAGIYSQGPAALGLEHIYVSGKSHVPML